MIGRKKKDDSQVTTAGVKDSVIGLLRRRWQLAALVGALAIAAVYFVVLRPASSSLADAQSQLASKQAIAAGLRQEITEAAQADSSDVATVRAQVEKYDNLLPHYDASGLTENLSMLLLDIPELLKEQFRAGIESVNVAGVNAVMDPNTRPCSQDPEALNITQLNSLFSSETGAASASEGDAKSANVVTGKWAISMAFGDPLPYSAAEQAQCAAAPGVNPRSWEQMRVPAQQAMLAGLERVNNITPLIVVESLSITVPYAGSDRSAGAEPRYMVKMSVVGYVTPLEGLAEIVPQPVPTADIPGYDAVGTLAPGTSRYESSDGSWVVLTVVAPGVVPATDNVVFLTAPPEILTSVPNRQIIVEITSSGELPLPLAEFAERITLLTFQAAQGSVAAPASS